MRNVALKLCLMLGAVAWLVGCGSDAVPDEPQRDAPSSTVQTEQGTTAAATIPAGPAATAAVGEVLSFVDHLATGDCFNEAIDEDGEFDYTQPPVVVDCNEQHLSEAFLIVAFPDSGSEYPDDDAFIELAEDVCERGYREYVGVEQGSTALGWFEVFPDEGEWALGERDLVCSLWLDDAPLRGIAAGIQDGVLPGNLADNPPLPADLRLIRVSAIADGAPAPGSITERSSIGFDDYYFAVFAAEDAGGLIAEFQTAIADAGWQVEWTLDDDPAFFEVSRGDESALIVIYDGQTRLGLYYAPLQ